MGSWGHGVPRRDHSRGKSAQTHRGEIKRPHIHRVQQLPRIKDERDLQLCEPDHGRPNMGEVHNDLNQAGVHRGARPQVPRLHRDELLLLQHHHGWRMSSSHRSLRRNGAQRRLFRSAVRVEYMGFLLRPYPALREWDQAHSPLAARLNPPQHCSARAWP